MKCRVRNCGREAEVRRRCRGHYDRDITPPSSKRRADLFRFMMNIEQILTTEWGLALPKGLVPRSVSEVGKEELRNRFKMLWHLLDTRITPKLRAQAKAEGFGQFISGEGYFWQKWEELCLTVARRLYGNVLLHPLLPNGKIPDLVPDIKGIQMTHGSTGAIQVTFAPLIIEAKFTITSAKLANYRRYCNRIEVWFFRWQPDWLSRRNPQVDYLSAHELATKCEAKRQLDLAKLLRCLPILWGKYEMAQLYGLGLKSFKDYHRTGRLEWVRDPFSFG